MKLEKLLNKIEGSIIAGAFVLLISSALTYDKAKVYSLTKETNNGQIVKIDESNNSDYSSMAFLGSLVLIGASLPFGIIRNLRGVVKNYGKYYGK